MPHTEIELAPATLDQVGPEAWLRVVTGLTDPAANTEISLTVPGRGVWEVLAVRFTLVTDATVATRAVDLIADDGTTEVARVPPASSQAASLTQRYSYLETVQAGLAVVTSGALAMPVPVRRLPPGWRLRTATTNLQATDNFTAPVLLVVERLREPAERLVDLLRAGLQETLEELAATR